MSEGAGISFTDMMFDSLFSSFIRITVLIDEFLFTVSRLWFYGELMLFLTWLTVCACSMLALGLLLSPSARPRTTMPYG